MSSEPNQPSEEELRAAYEAEIKRLRVEHILLDNVAALANLGMRRTGLAPGTESERDPAQVRLAIESIRALLPVVEQAAPSQVGAIRDAVSQLQIAFVRIGGAGEAGAAGKRAPRIQAPADRRPAGRPGPGRATSTTRAAAAGSGCATAAGSGCPTAAGSGCPTAAGACRAGAATTRQARRARPRPAQWPALGAAPVASALTPAGAGGRCGRPTPRFPEARAWEETPTISQFLPDRPSGEPARFARRSALARPPT